MKRLPKGFSAWRDLDLGFIGFIGFIGFKGLIGFIGLMGFRGLGFGLGFRRDFRVLG